ncbi:MAG TPA: ABC transporter ATP-binding protein [Terriglobales bacterium]|nr:ABC transporter ATP-binding protein [Terriglobales bacterium]
MDGVSLLPACLPNRAVLEVRDLSVSYGAGDETRVVVDALNFEIRAGEVLGVQGRSGCGKTSAALALLKLLPTSAKVSGAVFFRGRDLLKLPESELREVRGREVSIMYQEPVLALNPVMRVGEQISEILGAHTTLTPSERREQARQILDQVQLGSERYYRAYPHELSGGERHRVVLAQALVCRPALVIADEPTAGLDYALKNEILDLLDRLRRETGAALLLISHDRSVTGRLANRTVDLSLDGERRTPVVLMSAPSVADHRNSVLRENTQLVSVRNLSKSYQPRGLFRNNQADKQVLDCIDLSIARGSLMALVGPSGSGKSTLARCLALLERPDAGEILFEDKDLVRVRAAELRTFRARLQYVFQDAAAALNPRLSAAETIAEPLVIQNLGTREDRNRRAELLMEQTGLDPAVAHRSCHEFSGGQKQRLIIARALALQPSLLIFDESFSGLDPETRNEILDLLVSLRQKLGITQLLISHDLEVVSRVADSVAVMHDGRIVKQQHREDKDRNASIFPEQLLNAQARNPFALLEAK